MHVAVIIANRNYSDKVIGAMESAVEQDYEDRSIWVMDDGSDDNSWDVIFHRGKSPFLQTAKGIYSLRSDARIGQAACRNILVQKAWEQADVFVFLDSDDIYKYCYALDRYAESIRNGAGLAYADSDLYDERTGIRSPLLRPPYAEASLRASDIIGGNFAVSKEAFGTVGGFDESFRVAEGYDLALKISRKFPIVHIPEPLVDERIGNRSLRVSVPTREWSYDVARARNA
jgi:glycosyltransferase involved in cell wall biosynthesis